MVNMDFSRTKCWPTYFGLRELRLEGVQMGSVSTALFFESLERVEVLGLANMMFEDFDADHALTCLRSVKKLALQYVPIELKDLV